MTWAALVIQNRFLSAISNGVSFSDPGNSVATTRRALPGAAWASS